MGATTNEAEPQRDSLVGKIGRIVSRNGEKEVVYQGPIIAERFVTWNRLEAPHQDWRDYWRVTIAYSPKAVETKGKLGGTISVGEQDVQIVELPPTPVQP